MKNPDEIVITGTGIVCSLGHTPESVWNSLVSGSSGIRRILNFDTAGFPCKVAAQVTDIPDIECGLQTRFSHMMEKHLHMLARCSGDALTQSKADIGLIRREDIGFFAGMGMIDYRVEDLLPAVLGSMEPDGNLNYDIFFSSAYQEIYPLWPLAMLNNVAFCHVAAMYDIRGENSVFAPHADSGARAIAEGVASIAEGRSRLVLAGGVSENISPMSLARASLSGLLARTHTGGPCDPFVQCGPFCRDREGTILGEGCGMVALEPRSSAEEKNVVPLASISGFSGCSEAQEGSPCPTQRAIETAMALSLDMAHLEPSDIDVLIAHGDGTRAGDSNELQAIHSVFCKSLDKLAVFAPKGALGNLLAGSAAVDVIIGIQILRRGVIPATLNAAPVDPAVSFNLVYRNCLHTYPKRIMINSHSSEGQCMSMVLEKIE